jgi:hypothetical protein
MTLDTLLSNLKKLIAQYNTGDINAETLVGKITIIIEKANEVEACKEDVELVYKAYPARCPVRGASSQKSNKCRLKIARLLKAGYTVAQLQTKIAEYVGDCVAHTVYTAHFQRFLNTLPEIAEEEKPEPIKATPKQFIYE